MSNVGNHAMSDGTEKYGVVEEYSRQLKNRPRLDVSGSPHMVYATEYTASRMERQCHS